jgi:hypothetical protein
MVYVSAGNRIRHSNSLKIKIAIINSWELSAKFIAVHIDYCANMIKYSIVDIM